MKIVVGGLSAGDRVIVDTIKDFSTGQVKVQTEFRGVVSQAVCLGPAEAIALADALLASAKYITSKRK